MQNPYKKFILAIKTLVFDRFSKILQVLLRQIEIQLQNRKHVPSPPGVENSRHNSLSAVSFCTLKSKLFDKSNDSEFSKEISCFDIVCLSEIKCNMDTVNFEGYCSHVLQRKRTKSTGA